MTPPNRAVVTVAVVAVVLVVFGITLYRPPSSVFTAEPSRGGLVESDKGRQLERPALRDFVLAFYYPWYEPHDWLRHGPLYEHPKMGLYDTRDAAVVDEHIRLAKFGLIDGFLCSFNGPNRRADMHMRAGLLKAKNLGADFKFGIYLESLWVSPDSLKSSALHFDHPQAIPNMVSWLQHLNKHYFSHPGYLHFDGRPVVAFYVTRQWFGFNLTIKQDIETQLGTRLYWIADEPFLKGGYGDFDDPFTARNVFATGPYNHRVQLFDAYSPYNFYEWTRILPNETALQYFNKEAYHVSQRWAREVNFFPGLLSRYRDFRKPDHKLLGSPEEFEVMLQMVDKLPLRPVGNGIRHVIMLTSFNEYFEGTSLEPTVEHGDVYLRVLRRHFSRRSRYGVHWRDGDSKE
jgi:hypothetical protein